MSTRIKNTILVFMTISVLFGFTIWSLLKPDNTESASERRKLAQFPTLSNESVLNGKFMTEFEDYTLDQFPLRDCFRTIKAATVFSIFRQKDNNDIYIKNGYASKLDYPMDDTSIQYAAERFRFIYDRYLSGKNANVYISVIPDKNYFLAQENGYPSIDYGQFFDCVKKYTDFAAYIDISHLLELSDYYATDTHWRQEEILDVAQYLAANMDVTLSAKYTTEYIETPFFGVYHGQAAMPLPADALYYLDSPALHECNVYDYETNASIPVYDLDKTKGRDPYEMFLSGPKSLITIENPQASTNKELILFRDSFGSVLAPLFVEAYRKITLVDIRYLSPNTLDRFISFGNQDVLFLYSTSVLNNSITIK